MRKFLLLMIALLTSICGAWAQVVTDYSTAGSPVTYSTYVASAGTGAKYAFMMPSENSASIHKWVGFNSTVGNSENLTIDQLFVLENSSTPSKYWLKRYSNSEYLAGNNSFSSTPLDLTLDNRQAGDYASEYSSSDLHISFDNNDGFHFNNGNGSYNFAGGTGGWSTCIAYGPYYIAEVNCYEYGTSTPVQASVTYIVKNGTTINAPQVAGYTSNNESVTVNGADVVLNCYYNPIVFDPNDVAGKTFTMKCARGYVYWNGSAMKGHASNKTKFAIVTYDSDNDSNDETYLYDVDNNAFVCHTTAAIAGTSGNPALESNNDFSKIVKNISFGSTNFAAYPYYVQEDQFTNWLNMDGNPNVYFNRWTNFENGNGGNTYKIEIVDIDFDQTAAVAMLDAYFNPAATVKYVISDGNGYEYQTDFEPATVGDVITALPSDYQRAFCSYSAINHTIVAGENTINVTVTFNLPFETGTDKLYYAKLRNHYIYYDATNTDVRANQSSKENTDAYRWSFYGNPYSGIKVKNAQTGTYLDNTSSYVQLSAEGFSWTIHRLNETSTFGLYNGSNHINEQNVDPHHLIYWWAFETDAGSQWAVEEVPTNPVDVTYELWVGGVKEDEVVVEEVAPNSAVAVPAALTADYSTLAYDITTSGTIGESDCTITVTATLKSGVITALNQLSNSKTYTLTTERGALYIKSDHLASNSNANVGATPGEFVLFNYESNYYLYSKDASKFVLNDGSLSSTVTSNVVALTITEQTINPLYLFVLGSNGLNVTNTSDDYELVINSYVTPDAGNRYCIVEAGDFNNATDVEDALEDFFHGTTAFNNTIATLKAINWGLQSEGNKGKVNYYNVTSEAPADIYGFYGNEMAAITYLESNGYSQENLQAAQAMLAYTALNMPAAGFYRIQGQTSSNYLAAGMANSKFAMSDATDATTIFYFDGTYLTNFSSGMCNGMTKDDWAWVKGADASTVTFADGETNGGYAIKSKDAFFYDGGTYADRGSSLGTDGRYRSWYLTEVTTLPVTISAAGYATFCSPVAVTIPEGVTAYVGTLDHGDYLHLEAIEGGIIPANEGVILKGTAGTYDFNLTTGGSAAGNLLTGTVAAIARPADSYVLSGGDYGLGFYKDGAETIPGFKAYLQGTAGVKGFLGFIFDDADAIENIVKQIPTNDEYYDLSGRRVSKPTKGMYIINGKKVLVK